MIYHEETRDLFSLPAIYKYVHCVSSDFKLGAGIALEFSRRFDMKERLRQDYFLRRWDGEGYCVYEDPVFNLVTKYNYFNKPTYQSIEEALLDMKTHIMKMNAEGADIHQIGMPLIACGLDGLSWKRVSLIVQNVFLEMDIEICVCRKEKQDG